MEGIIVDKVIHDKGDHQESKMMSGYGMRGMQMMHRPSSGHYGQRGYGYSGSSGYGESRNYARSMMSRFTSTFDRRRRQDMNVPSRPSTPTQRYGDGGTGSGRPLVVELTEFYPRDNAKEHHTEMYELVSDAHTPTPVLRRGQNFFFAIRFDRSFEQQRDYVRVNFTFGARPSVTKGTRVILPVSHQHERMADKTGWSMNIHRHDGNTLSLQVYIPASAQVGIWRCQVQTNFLGQRDHRKEYKCEEDMYVLFNPWCRDDPVYMEGDSQRREYVMNETGKIWMGSYKQPRGRRWIFGQFDDVVLPATMYLLEQSGLPHPDRGSPVQVVRAISAVVGSLDDNGLLVGRWDGDYKDGTSPHAWTGSVAIMEQYLAEGGQPVKYGQCWNFSALIVTMCRALGIPCRSVTNYVSAHDTSRSLTVDKFFDKDGNEMERGPEGDNTDSCWNFHVWNDVWMSRPDLPPGYGGWQIIDGTPQEESDNMFRCGPSSVEAVRRGDIGFAYDTPFMFCEVNADLAHFQEDDQSDWGFSRLSLNQYQVGRRIVTKRIDRDDDDTDNDMMDVTSEYKNTEGSHQERLAVFNACRGSPKTSQTSYYDHSRGDRDRQMGREQDDVYFDMVDIEMVPYGQSFDVMFNIQNKSSDTRTVTAVMTANSCYYTGTTASRLKRAHGEFVIRPGQREVLKIHVNPSEYMDKLVDHGMIKMYAIAHVKETRQTWSEEDDIVLQKPRMSVQMRGSARVGQECYVTFSFQNPLNTTLTDCYFTVEGPGLQRPRQTKHRDVRAGELVTFSETFVPRRQGERRIMATFTSRQMSEVVGSTAINVHH